ncbi:hypothetical protein HV270_26385 (plasmid) [Citrobacter freundii]|uniref:Uncharacterized protein n=1 Tax=Citrobacter werkmanii TaxID=67827 RepID=A0AA37ZCE3_9ENTR|nr:hypothetical protein [Citrobacter freundii]QLV95548.1 hypothetical protein HV270_26385 [Citrobacter freundii]HAT7594842.1 hypothetical protein [Citrobacter werkmanii]
MSENSADVREDAKKRVSNVVSDRLKDGFYGYLITAFFIGNWQNIFMLFMSKKPIEETIQNIISQPDFMADRFWWPLAYGTLAAFIMPWVVVVYVRLVAAARSHIKSAERAADAAREIKLAKSALKAQLQYNQKANLADLLEKQKNDYEALEAKLASNLIAKENFDKFFVSLNKVFVQGPRIENKEDLIKFFENAKREGIFEYYNDLSLPSHLENGEIAWVLKSPSPSPRITTETPQM